MTMPRPCAAWKFLIDLRSEFQYFGEEQHINSRLNSNIGLPTVKYHSGTNSSDQTKCWKMPRGLSAKPLLRLDIRYFMEIRLPDATIRPPPDVRSRRPNSAPARAADGLAMGG